MQTIVILGANGRIGTAAAKAFHAAGYRVIAITRTGRADHLPGEIETRAADALDRDQLVVATKGAHIIFNGLNPPYHKWRQMAEPLARNVVAAAKANEATHLFPGNVYNYGRNIPPECDPLTPFFANTKKGRLRITMEDIFEAAASQHQVQTIILRAGDFYGGSVGGSWLDLVITAKLAKGIFTYPGPIDVPHAWAYLPDLAKAFVALAGKRKEFSNFETFTFAGHTMTGAEMMAHASVAVAGPLKRASLPWILVRAGGLVNPVWRELPEISYLWFRPHRLCGDKLALAVGALDATPPDKAVSKAIRDLADAGQEQSYLRR